jgi:Zn-dependent protease with chaperone function
MNPFPHFADLPPATAAQAAAIHAALRVTPSILRFDGLTSALSIAADVYVLALIWLILQTGLAAKFRDWSERLAPWGGLYVQGIVTYLAISLALAIAGLPLSFYRGWIVLKRYGLSNQTPASWLLDHFKAIGINALVGALVAGLLCVIIQRYPRKWPYGFAAALAPIIAFGIFLSPLIVDPLFNQFTLLSHSRPVWAGIHDLAEKAGIGGAAIYVVDKSKQSNEVNAYVTGFGPSLRIVIWDTTLKKLDYEEIVAVVGHEMGHYVEGHLVFGFALSVVGLFIVFPLIRLAALGLICRCGDRWRLRSLHDPAALALLLLCLQASFLITQPITNTISRYIEHRADAFSLGMVRSRMGLARAFVVMSKIDLDNPYPPLWEKIWFDDHPPDGERVDFALYGQPNK